MQYNFEYLKELYKKDPDEFEIVTTVMIDSVISTARADNREKLRAKQWRLQQDLKKIKDPLERMNRMVSIFWSGVHEFVNVTKDLSITKNVSITNQKACKIINIKQQD